MMAMIEDENAPSLLELRERIATQFRHTSAADGGSGELTCGQLDAFCEALLYLAHGTRGRLQYLANFWHQTEWAEVGAWLDALAAMFPEEIEALRRHIDTWMERFWASGGHRTQQEAFQLGVANMMLEVFTAQPRQHLLACYGESS